MIVMTCNNIRKAFGDEILFDNVSFQIELGDKVGLVGVNGTGKTTLFKILTGEVPDDGGSIFLHKQASVGYMQQAAILSSDKTVWEELMTVFTRQKELEQRLDVVNTAIEQGAGEIEALTLEQHELQEAYEKADGYVYQSKARGALIGLGFSTDEFDLPFAALSGGQKTRVMLCKILLGDANLLLLDEPTNHLDIESTQWLEGFLKEYKGAVVVISHDRYFLDKVTSKTLELENKKLTVYGGNYTRYLELKREAQEAAEKVYKNTQKEISRIEGIIEQQHRWNRERNIKTAESKQKMVDRLKESLEKPSDTPEAIHFTFHTAPGGGNDVLYTEGLKKSFDGRNLFYNVNLDIKKGERVFLLGPNGCGKTTLLRILMGEYQEDAGSFQFGANIIPGYYDQTQSGLHDGKTILDEVWDTFPKMTQTEVRNALAIFLFQGDDVFKSIAALSGGEKARVALLKLMLSKANLLLLDEPTNHLDIASKEALEDALSGYEGTLFVVSHDRYFINKTADKIYYLTQDGTKCYDGNYDYFLEKSTVTSSTNTKVEQTAQNTSYKEQKQKEAMVRKRQNQINRLEEEIAQAECVIETLEKEQMNPDISSDYIRLGEIGDAIDTENQKLTKLYEQWEQLQLE